MGKHYSIEGVEISDEQFEEWAAPWGAGEVPGVGGPVIIGRPRISAEELSMVTFKLPESQLAALDAAAERAGETRSQFLRHIIGEALASA